MFDWLARYSNSVSLSKSVPRQDHAITRPEFWWTIGVLTVLAVARAALNLPSLSLARWYVGQLGEGARILIGQPLISGDIGGNFAQARALIEPSFSAYDRLVEIFPLVGVTWDVQHGHPRLPMEIVLYVPAAALGHSSPAYQAIAFALPVIGILCMAWSLRLLDVPVIPAWLVTTIVVASPIGVFALESSYPIVAIAFAVGWRFRDRPAIAAIGLVVAGAGRGLALLPVTYFVIARSWRTVIWLFLALLALLVIATTLEPAVIRDFLDRGLEWGRINAARPDNASLTSVLVRPIYAYVAAFVIFVLAARRAELLFWALVWLAAALAPIAWTYAAVALFPLGAFLWHMGRIAKVVTLISIVILVANEGYSGLTYGLIVSLLGVGLIVSGWNAKSNRAGGHPGSCEEQSATRPA